MINRKWEIGIGNWELGMYRQNACDRVGIKAW
jgi:hypothetical protein